MWEKVAEATKPESGTSPDSPSRNVYRFPVPGGWLYIAAYYGVSNMVFVPHPTSQDEKVTSAIASVLNHLDDDRTDDTKRRDELGAAYARGFADGQKPPTDELLEAMEELIDTASEMIVPDTMFSNRDYAEADTVIRRAQRALAFAKGGK